MASEPGADRIEIRVAGQSVEVTDPTHSLHGNVGTIAFFVGDNVYVTFADRRWAPTKMFFPDQLRARTQPQARTVPLRRRAAASALLVRLRLSLLKLRN